MALKPPSPPSAFCHVVLLVELLVFGEPLSCVPPSRMSALVGCTENETNSVIEPRLSLRLSNWFVPVQLPVFSPEYPSSVRLIPPSCAKYPTALPLATRNAMPCWSGCTCAGAPSGPGLHP